MYAIRKDMIYLLLLHAAEQINCTNFRFAMQARSSSYVYHTYIYKSSRRGATKKNRIFICSLRKNNNLKSTCTAHTEPNKGKLCL